MESKARVRRRTKPAADPFGFDAPGERRPSAEGAGLELAALFGDEFPVPEMATAQPEPSERERPTSAAEWVERVDGSISDLARRVDQLVRALRTLNERLARVEAHGLVTEEISRGVADTLRELLGARRDREAGTEEAAEA